MAFLFFRNKNYNQRTICLITGAITYINLINLFNSTYIASSF